jgi:hypothetical protein
MSLSRIIITLGKGRIELTVSIALSMRWGWMMVTGLEERSITDDRVGDYMQANR